MPRIAVDLVVVVIPAPEVGVGPLEGECVEAGDRLFQLADRYADLPR